MVVAMTDPTQAPLTLFAPVRIDPDRRVSDLDRFLALALPSFRRHLGPDVVHEILVVVPPSDLRRASAALADAGPIPVRVLDERLLGVDTTGASSGWVAQQILKLAAFRLVTTPWFVTIDADVVATRSVDLDFLLPGGRAIWEQEAAGAHYPWWVNSARVLGVPTAVSEDDAAFGVTPAILSTDALRGLSLAIEAAHPGTSWDRTLIRLQDWGWTEYTLYWTHLLATGQAGRLYADVARFPYALGGSMWTPEQLQASTPEDLRRVFAPDADHAFTVFQSNLEVPLADTVRLLRPLIDDGAGDVTPEELARWARHTRAHARRTLRHKVSGRLRSLRR
jgi:hypothetical protein